MKTRNYLVVIDSQFIRDMQIAPTIEADHGDDWDHFEGQVVVGTFAATSKEQAIKNAQSTLPDTDIGMFDAYTLA